MTIARARLEDLEALGYHFSRSADRIKGARHLVAAGDWARAIYANADAVRNYELALRTLEECAPSDGEHVAVEERLGDVLGLMGRREPALGRFAAVLDAAAARGDRPTQARLHRKMAALHWNAGQRELARQTLEAGLALLDGEGSHIELAHLYQEMGRLLFRSGDSAGAIVWAERALVQVEPLVPHAGQSEPRVDEARKEAAAAMSHAYNTLGVALARAERLDEAVRHIERSVDVAQTHGLLQAACRGYANLSVLYSTSTRGGPSRHAVEVSSWPSRSGTRPSSRVSTRISPWPTAPSPTGVTATASRRPRRRSSSTASWASWTTSPCR